MLRLKLIDTASAVKNAKELLNSHMTPRVLCIPKYMSMQKKAKEEEIDEFDKPYKFSTSGAASWPVAYTRADVRNIPSYQGVVISLSLTVFMIYFGILREENDIDEKMTENIPPDVQELIFGPKARRPKNTDSNKMT